VLACASGPYPTTRATDARSSDPWIEGEPCGAAPRDDAVRIEEVAPGSGKVTERGDTIRAHYKATLPNGDLLRDSRSSGPPVEIIVGSTKTICGFEKGLIGMQPGGQRRIFVPWRLAFGEAGRPPDVPPRADLVFVIDLFSPGEPPAGSSGGAARPPMPGRRR
jgi:FKBP-type peptidyl-prolyl cis-trans isomerase